MFKHIIVRSKHYFGILYIVRACIEKTDETNHIRTNKTENTKEHENYTFVKPKPLIIRGYIIFLTYYIVPCTETVLFGSRYILTFFLYIHIMHRITHFDTRLFSNFFGMMNFIEKEDKELRRRIRRAEIGLSKGVLFPDLVFRWPPSLRPHLIFFLLKCEYY